MKTFPSLVGAFLGLFTVPVLAEEGAELKSAFGPGEASVYRVEYLGITAGSAKITVGSEMEQWGQKVWPIVTLARTDSLGAVFPIKEKFVTYWDPAANCTIGSDLYAEENKKRRRQRIKLNGDGKAEVTKQRDGEAEVQETHEVQEGTLDIAAAALALRNRELVVGQEHELPVFTGKKSFLLKAKVESKETLKTKLGEREVFKVRAATQFSGKLASKRDMIVYLATDPSHMMVRLEAEFLIGSLVAELTEYQPGREVAMRMPRGG